MAKEKGKSKGASANKHWRARVAYLHQAASHLSRQAPAAADMKKMPSVEEARPEVGRPGSNETPTAEPKHVISDDKTKAVPKSTTSTTNSVHASHNPSSHPLLLGPAARLSDQLMQVARKSQIRLDRPVKHQICKSCSNLLIDGSTCRKYVENLSKDGKKPHADISITECNVCGTKKRQPLGARRQLRKSARLR